MVSQFVQLLLSKNKPVHLNNTILNPHSPQFVSLYARRNIILIVGAIGSGVEISISGGKPAPQLDCEGTRSRLKKFEKDAKSIFSVTINNIRS